MYILEKIVKVTLIPWIWKLVKFNQEKTLITLAKMIIIDEIPCKFVENEGIRKFIQQAQP